LRIESRSKEGKAKGCTQRKNVILAHPMGNRGPEKKGRRHVTEMKARFGGPRTDGIRETRLERTHAF